MDEKIKITIPKKALDKLKKDCVDFRIIKEDGTPNFNAFLNQLVANHYETFSASEQTLHTELREALSGVPEYYREQAFLNTLKIITQRNYEAATKPSAQLSFKPTRLSRRATMHIGHILSAHESLSSYYRRLFLSYVGLPKNERELIIHREHYEYLTEALRLGVKVCLTFRNDNILKGMSVYAVASSKDELFNYVLFYNGKQNVTVRLASIQEVTLLPDRSVIPDENKALFDRQIACAVQFPIYNTDREPIRVKLDEKGKRLFEKIYLYRPAPTKIEGDIYTFECSANQLLYYFERFGDSALILSPKKLGIFMRNYYHFALKKYKSIYGHIDY